MAITILDQPTANSLRPAFAPIEYLTSSTSTGQSGFKLICSIRFNAGVVANINIETIPSTTQQLLTAQNVIKSYVSSLYSVLDGDTINMQTISLPSFFVDFREYYNGLLQGTTVSSSSIRAYYSSPKYVEFASGTYLKYQLNNLMTGFDPSLIGYLLSSFDNYKVSQTAIDTSTRWMSVKRTQKIQAGWLVNTNNSNFRIELRTYDINNTLVQYVFINEVMDKGKFALDIGYNELDIHTWSAALNLTNVIKWALTIVDLDNLSEPVSHTYLYEIDDCYYYNPFEIHWLNRWGGYDSFVFDGKSKHTTSNDKTLAKQKPKRISGSVLEYATHAEEVRPFHISTTDKYELTSRLIKNYEVAGFEDLFSSPEVYWRSPYGFISVIINGRTYEHRDTQNGQVFSVDLEMELNNNERQW